MNYDSLGLIVQLNNDGGDCAARTGEWYFANAHLILKYSSAVDLLESSPGRWCRHPIQYPDTKDFSRDQTDPNIIAMGHLGDTAPLKRMFLAQLKRFFLYQNGDLPMPLTFALYIRAFEAWYLYPLLLLFDLGFMWCFIGSWIDTNPDHVDDNNMVLRFIQAIYIYPTPWSFFGRKLYAKARPVNNGNVIKGETNTVMGAFTWYHRPESFGNFEIAEAYRPLILKYFSQESDE